jgi:N-acetylglucosamine-6-phosphate deacetylase
MLTNLSIIAGALAELGIEYPCIHCEGPFFHGKDGAIGAHPPTEVKPADVNLLERMIAASNRRIKILTVGANVPGIEAVISRAVSHNIVVSLGHHVPTLGQIDSAIAAGANMFTHLGNGCPSDVPRRGFMDYQLSLPVGAGFIPDGSHLEDYYLRNLLRLKGWEKAIPVSDRSALGGAPCLQDGEWYSLWGSKVRIVPNGSTFMLVGTNGKLAGSWEDLFACANYLARVIYKTEESQLAGWKDVSFAREMALWSMMTTNPMRYWGITATDFAALAKKLKIRKVKLEHREFSLA